MKRHEDELLSRYFDGELPYEALSEELKDEAKEFERITALLEEGRVRAPASLKPAVMTEVRRLAESPWRRSVHALLAPRTIRVRPAVGAVALAAAAALVLLARPEASEPAGPALPMAEPVAATPEGVLTRFSFVAPAASHVAVTGDFLNWDLDGVPMTDPRGNGVWVAQLRLAPGLHHYAFVIDGRQWLPDPNALSQVDDGFGQRNSVLLVPGPSTAE